MQVNFMSLLISQLVEFKIDTTGEETNFWQVCIWIKALLVSYLLKLIFLKVFFKDLSNAL